MNTVNVPTTRKSRPSTKRCLTSLHKGLGFVPNLYATLAHSETALGTYLALQNAKSSLNAKEREVINLVVSQFNDCHYCLAAHTALGKMHGFSDAQIIEIRRGAASFDPKLDALARVVRSVTLERGHPDLALVQAFFAAGWTEANLVDALVVVGDKMVSNFLHGATQIPAPTPTCSHEPGASHEHKHHVPVSGAWTPS